MTKKKAEQRSKGRADETSRGEKSKEGKDGERERDFWIFLTKKKADGESQEDTKGEGRTADEEKRRGTEKQERKRGEKQTERDIFGYF